MSPQTAQDDLDKTIEMLVEWLDKANGDKKATYKERMAITDRLLKALALKYKHTDEGKGGKFANLGTGAGK